MQAIDEFVCSEERSWGCIAITLSLGLWLTAVVAAAVFPNDFGWQILMVGVPAAIGVFAGTVFCLLECCGTTEEQVP